jgi:phospholipid/cholesterol/gamma-HCH transport system permease protein
MIGYHLGWVTGTAMIGRLGKVVLSQLSDVGRLTIFAWQAGVAVALPPYRVGDIFRQMWLVGVRSLPIASLTALFVGMVMVLNSGYQLQRFGAKLYAAGIAIIALTREMVPVFTAVVVGARVAASMTAELGTMKITEQLEAMQALAVNPTKYLVAPRVIATTLMLPIIAIYANVVGFLGGLVVGVSALNIPFRLYWTNTLDFLSMGDLYSGIVKTFFFGAIIGIVGCYFGFRTEGGAQGVGQATTTSVVLTLILVLLFDFILTSWFLYMTKTIG